MKKALALALIGFRNIFGGSYNSPQEIKTEVEVIKTLLI